MFLRYRIQTGIKMMITVKIAEISEAFSGEKFGVSRWKYIYDQILVLCPLSVTGIMDIIAGITSAST